MICITDTCITNKLVVKDAIFNEMMDNFIYGIVKSDFFGPQRGHIFIENDEY